MRAPLACVCAVAFLIGSPASAVAEVVGLAVGAGDSETGADVAAALEAALGDRGAELVAAEAVAAALGEPLAAEPTASTLEEWARALGADLFVAAVVESEESATTVRLALFDAGRGVASAASETGPRSEAAAMAAGLLATLVPERDEQVEAGASEEAVPPEVVSDAPPPPAVVPTPPPRREGRVQFVLSSTFLGLSIMASVLFTANVRDPRLFAPILLAGGGGGLATAFVVGRTYSVSRGDNSLVTAGGFWGGGMGLLLAGALGFDDLQWLMTGALAGQVLGLGAGVVAAAFTEISPGDGAVLHSGAIWGLFGGGVLATLVSHEDPRASYGMILAGLVAGLGAGALAAHFVEISAGRAAIVDLCGFLGVLLGASVGTPIIIDEQSTGNLRAYAGIILGAAAAGLGVGALLTRRWDDREAAGAEGGDSATEPVSSSRRRAPRYAIPLPVPTVIPAAEGVPGAQAAFGVQLGGLL